MPAAVLALSLLTASSRSSTLARVCSSVSLTDCRKKTEMRPMTAMQVPVMVMMRYREKAVSFALFGDFGEGASQPELT